MKKFLIAAVALLSFGAANAQVAYVGYLNNTLEGKTGSITTTNTAPGFVLGGSMNFDIIAGIGVQPALQLEFYSKTEDEGKITEFTNKSIGVKMPVEINYGYEINSNFKVYAFAGPTFYYGVSDKAEAKNANTTVDRYEDLMNRFNLGLGCGAWLDVMDMIRIKAAWDFGQSNLYQDGDSDNKLTKNTFNLSVGYVF